MNKSAPGTVSATALVIASMIGTGVFTSLGFQLVDLDSAPQILLLWALGGGIALCGALCYARVARALPRSGGEHHFLTELYHPSLGFMAGVLSAVSGFAAPTAITALAFGAYFHEALPAVPVRVGAVAVILLGTLAHRFSARTSAAVQTAATSIKLLLILAFLVAAAVLPGQGDIRWEPEPATDFLAILQPAFAVSLLYVLYSYSGWNAAVYGLESWHDRDRTVRRALIVGTLVVAVLYIALNAAFLHAAPVAELRERIEIGHVAAVSLFGESAARPVSGLFALGLFASVSALLWAGPHVLAAMGRNVPGLAALAPAAGPPRIALLIQAALALLGVALGRFDDLITFTQVGLTLSTMLTVAGIFRLPRTDQGRPLVAAVVFLAMSGFVVVYSIVAKPGPTLIGLALVAIATLLWFPLKKLRS